MCRFHPEKFDRRSWHAICNFSFHFTKTCKNPSEIVRNSTRTRYSRTRHRLYHKPAKINLAAAINTRRIDNKSFRKIRSTDK